MKSPLNPYPVILRPLTDTDIEEMFHIFETTQTSQIDLNAIVTINSNVKKYLCKRLAQCSGGDGRTIEYALEELVKICKGKTLIDNSAVDVVLAKTYKALKKFMGRRHDICSLLIPGTQVGTLILQCHDYLINQIPFDYESKIVVGDKEVLVTAALDSVGYTFASMEGSDQFTAKGGEWMIDHLNKFQDMSVIEMALTVKKEQNHQVRSLAFQQLCYYAFKSTANRCPTGRSIGDIFPFLKNCDISEVPMKKFTLCHGPRICADARKWSNDVKDSLLQMDEVKRTSLPNITSIHPDDLYWLLIEWLPEFAIFVPADNSVSQDWFVKLTTDYLCFATKLYCDGMQPVDIRVEIGKMPKNPSLSISSEMEPSDDNSEDEGPRFALVVCANKLSASVKKLKKHEIITFSNLINTDKITFESFSTSSNRILIIDPEDVNGLSSLLGMNVKTLFDNRAAATSEL